MLCKPVTRTRAVSAHASLSTFALFAALAYRNIWPLLTFVYAPADGASVTLWSTIALAGVAGLFVPLFEPFVYIPFDPAVSASFRICDTVSGSQAGQRPQVAMNPEQVRSFQTASVQNAHALADGLAGEPGHLHLLGLADPRGPADRPPSRGVATPVQ
jgi:hypothetical protein